MHHMHPAMVKMRAVDESFSILEGIQLGRQHSFSGFFFLEDSEDQINSDSFASNMVYFIN